jgi:hypothetical protein
MRYKPLLGLITLKTQKMRKKREEVWKVISMCGNGTMTLQGDPLVETLFLKVTHMPLLGLIKKGISATC